MEMTSGKTVVQRSVKDVDEVLAAMNLSNVTMLGHSMGCSALWCHFDLFGTSRIARCVFCDQASFLDTDPAWTAQETANHGPIFTPDSVTTTASMPADKFHALVTGFVG